MRGRVWQLARDRRGVSAIELGIALPVLAVMLMGVADLALGYSQKLKVQQASARTIEMATASGLNGAAFQLLKAEAASAAGVSQDAVTLDKWLECDAVRQPSFDGTCASGAQIGRFVSIAVSGSYRPLFPVGMGSSTTIPIGGYAQVRVQ